MVVVDGHSPASTMAAPEPKRAWEGGTAAGEQEDASVPALLETIRELRALLESERTAAR